MYNFHAATVNLYISVIFKKSIMGKKKNYNIHPYVEEYIRDLCGSN